MNDRERVLTQSGNNITNLITLMTLHEENISRNSRIVEADNQLLTMLTSYLSSETILQHVNQCIYQNIIEPINQTCPITRENFQPTDEVIMLNNCNHIFKRPSIIRWLQRNNTCPVCRANVL